MAEAQKSDREVKTLIDSSNHSLNLKKIQWGTVLTSLYCCLAGEALRPYIPATIRNRVFKLFHNPVHPWAKVTDRVIRKRYVWPDMHRDIARWCKTCQECQQSKVTRHNHLAPAQFVSPEGKFRHVHMDVVGPLPESDGYKYCLTMIDLLSGWPGNGSRPSKKTTNHG